MDGGFQILDAMSPIGPRIGAAAGPDRYWVGGAATWDGTAGTKWASSSGGVGGASVPTSATNVFFDANSGATTCTLSASSVCANLNCTGYTGTISHPAATTLTIHGSLTLVAGMTYTLGNTATSAITFASTSTGRTINTGVKNVGNIVFNGVGGGWTLSAAITQAAGASFTVTNGNFNSGNQTMSVGTFSSANSNTRTITLGSSTVNVATSWDTGTTTNLTFSAGTSQIVVAVANTVFSGGGLTFATVTHLGMTATRTINGANTYGTLSVSSGASVSGDLSLSANQTVSGTFKADGNSVTQRLFVRSNTMGTARTITAATVACTNIDLRDITGAGAGSWNLSAISGLSGNGGGNSGITFTTPSTSYWVGGTGNWATKAEWSSSSGGTADNHRVPLLQDTAVFDANSFSAGSQTVDIQSTQAPRMCNISASAVTNSPTFTRGGTSVEYYGGFVMGTATITNTSTIYTFVGRGSHNINLGTSPAATAVTIESFGGTYTWQAGYTGTTYTHTRGTVDFNDFNFTWTSTFAFSNSNTKTITMGNGTFTLSGTGTLWNAGATGTTFNRESSTIDFTNTSATTKTMAGAGLSYNNVRVRGASGAATFTFTGANTIASLTLDPNANTRWPNATTNTINAVSINGTSGNLVVIRSTSGTATWSDSAGTNAMTFCNITSMTFTGGATWTATSSTNGGGNTGITITP